VKGKPGVTERGLQILDQGEKLLAECAQVVDAFLAGGAREPLCSSLWEIQEKLHKLRE
jgi:hypothetical protein